MTRTMKAAAVPVGAVVVLPESVISNRRSIEITKIENSTPHPGKLVWFDQDGLEVEIGGATDVQVVSLP